MWAPRDFGHRISISPAARACCLAIPLFLALLSFLGTRLASLAPKPKCRVAVSSHASKPACWGSQLPIEVSHLARPFEVGFFGQLVCSGTRGGPKARFAWRQGNGQGGESWSRRADALDSLGQKVEITLVPSATPLYLRFATAHNQGRVATSHCIHRT